ncbi:MAG: hypothetical protein U0169_13855 [Polyangiaceae bacterium]
MGVWVFGAAAYAAADASYETIGDITLELDLSSQGPFGPAVVSLPTGANSPRPVVVALHGRNEKPERMCALVREWVGVRAFVVCPRGTPAAEGAGFDFVDDTAASREVEASVSALVSRFGSMASATDRVYVGFSRGAFVGPAVVARAAKDYRSVILVEGGQDLWTEAAVADFAAGGTARVLFACGTPDCWSESERPASALERAGIPSKRVMGEGQGHDMGGTVKAAIEKAFPWVVDGDDRWSY